MRNRIRVFQIINVNNHLMTPFSDHNFTSINSNTKRYYFCIHKFGTYLSKSVTYIAWNRFYIQLKMVRPQQKALHTYRGSFSIYLKMACTQQNALHTQRESVSAQLKLAYTQQNALYTQREKVSVQLTLIRTQLRSLNMQQKVMLQNWRKGNS